MPESYTPRHAAFTCAREARDAAIRAAGAERDLRRRKARAVYDDAVRQPRAALIAECDAADRKYDETLRDVAGWYRGMAAAASPEPPPCGATGISEAGDVYRCVLPQHYPRAHQAGPGNPWPLTWHENLA